METREFSTTFFAELPPSDHNWEMRQFGEDIYLLNPERPPHVIRENTVYKLNLDHVETSVLFGVPNWLKTVEPKTIRDVLELFLPVVARYADTPVNETPREVRKFGEGMQNTWGVNIENIDWADVDTIKPDKWTQDWFDYYSSVAAEIFDDERGS